MTPFVWIGPKPTYIYEYHNADKSIAFVVTRLETPDGQKTFRQYTFDTLKNKWSPRGVTGKTLRPMFRLPDILARPDAPVLVLEGEKKALHVQALLPDWVVTCWAGGANGVKRTDFSPLRSRDAVVFADNDLPGIKAAHDVASASGARYAQPPGDFPEGWDLGDPIPAPYTLAQLLESAESLIPPPPGASAEIDYTPPAAPAEDRPAPYYRALGTADQKFYFLSTHTQSVMVFQSRDLRSGNALLDLVPDELHWARIRSTRSGIDWKSLGTALVSECYRAGHYAADRLRGRGVWLDKDRIIAHLGTEIWVDNEVMRPIDIESYYIYQHQERLIELRSLPPLTDAEGEALLSVFRKPFWTNKLSGELLAGIVATSVICGTLKFRTHAWVTGPSGAGKTYVLEEIIGRSLGAIAINIVGNSTEAGIRQQTSQDARPVIYDEAEGRGQIGKQRRQLIIDLMRATSANASGSIIKGGANHQAQSFQVKTQFILGSISVGIKDMADETRCLVMTLRGTGGMRKDDASTHFQELQAMTAALPSHLPERLLRRMTQLVGVVRANAETFRRVIARHWGNSRLGDQMGTPLAGAVALRSAHVFTEAEAYEHLRGFPWASYTHPDSDIDENALLAYLGASIIQVEQSGQRHGRTIAEVCEIAAMSSLTRDDEVVNRTTARATLQRYGIMYEVVDEARGFWIANTHRELDRIMRDSPYPEGFSRIIARLPAAKKSPLPKRFAGVQSRATWIPLTAITDVAVAPMNPPPSPAPSRGVAEPPRNAPEPTPQPSPAPPSPVPDTDDDW